MDEAGVPLFRRPPRRGGIYLSDLAVVLSELRPPEGEEALIARLLGFEIPREPDSGSMGATQVFARDPEDRPGEAEEEMASSSETPQETPTMPEGARPGIPEPVVTPPRERHSPDEPREAVEPPEAAPPAGASDDPGSEAVEVTLETFSSLGGGKFDVTFEEEPDPSDEEYGAEDPSLSLLSPQGAPQIMRAMVSQSRPGPVNMPAAVKAAARLETLKEIPRKTLQTLNFGCDLLLDMGAGLRPFLQDRAEIHALLEKVMGRDRIRCRYFVDCPELGVGAYPGDTSEEYREPHHRRPVLVISDLCIGQPATAGPRASMAHWRAFVRKFEARTSQLLCLVPYPPYRWPFELLGRLTMVPWDRTTSVATIRRCKEFVEKADEYGY